MSEELDLLNKKIEEMQAQANKLRLKRESFEKRKGIIDGEAQFNQAINEARGQIHQDRQKRVEGGEEQPRRPRDINNENVQKAEALPKTMEVVDVAPVPPEVPADTANEEL